MVWLPETLSDVISGFRQAFVLTRLCRRPSEICWPADDTEEPAVPETKKALIKKPIHFYACDRITALSEQLYGQTLANPFFVLDFQCLFVVVQAVVSWHVTLSLQWPLLRTIVVPASSMQ